MRSTSRCADCWTRLTLLAPPDPASTGLDRARVVSLRRVLFSFSCHFFPNVYSYVRIDTSQSDKLLYSKNLSTWTDRLLSLCPRRLRLESSTRCFLFVTFFLFQCKNTYDHRCWLKCRLSNREVSSIYIHGAAGAAGAAAAALCVANTTFSLLLRGHRVRFHIRVPRPSRLYLFYCTLLHDVRVCTRIYLPAAV